MKTHYVPMQQPHRHPAEVTADRLAYTVGKYARKFDGRERDEIDMIIHALHEIAKGMR